MKFTHDALVGFEEEFVWEDEDGRSFIFSDDNSGIMVDSSEELDFTWKINAKGILLVKYSSENRFWILSTAKNGVLEVDIYKRISGKLHKVESLSLKKSVIEDSPEEVGLIEALRGFDDAQKAYMLIINLVALFGVFACVFLLPIISNFGILVKLIAGIVILGAVAIKSITITASMPKAFRDRLNKLLA